MIYVYQMLKKIRQNNAYKSSSIQARIGVSETEFRKMESQFVPLSNKLLTDWMSHLDIPKQDHLYYLQKHLREQNYEALKQCPSLTDEYVRQRIADLITFNTHITKIGALLTSVTLEHIEMQPRSARIAVEDIQNDRTDTGCRKYT